MLQLLNKLVIVFRDSYYLCWRFTTIVLSSWFNDNIKKLDILHAQILLLVPSLLFCVSATKIFHVFIFELHSIHLKQVIAKNHIKTNKWFWDFYSILKQLSAFKCEVLIAAHNR